MKIVQIITLSDLGGAQSVVVELSNELSKRGHDVIVMSKPNGPMWNLLNSNITRIPCNSLCREIHPIRDLKSFLFIRKVLKNYKPDIIHLHSSKAGVLGRLATFPYYTKKTFYTVHGFDTILKANKIFLPLEKVLKKFCAKIIAVSNYDLVNLSKNNINNVQVIYNAINDGNKNSIDNAVVKKIQTMSQNKKIILSIARDAKPKRLDLFIDVAQKLPQYTFIWIGNKDTYKGIPENLFFMGEIPNAGAYISAADLFVLFSDYEGLPMSIIESLSCGIPVIASKVGGIVEILDGKAGYVVENDIEYIIEKITTVFSNADLYKQLKSNSSKQYLQSFTVKTMVDSYEQVYISSVLHEKNI